MASTKKTPAGTWKARYRDDDGKEFAKNFRRKVDAQSWLDEQTAALVAGTHRDPNRLRLTCREWRATWLEGYAINRPSSVISARTHIKLIVAEFGDVRLTDVRPSSVKGWLARLSDAGSADSYVYALHNRLSQIMADAVHDGRAVRNPCSRRTSPGPAGQRAYVATTEQVWALHDAFPEHLRPAILLGAFAGLRVAEAAALRPSDVDFMRGIIHPAIQWPAKPLKTKMSQTPIPIPQDLALELSASVAAGQGPTVVRSEDGGAPTPWMIERAIRRVRVTIPGLPEGFRFHDLRHYSASLLIAEGVDIKTVQYRMRHSHASTTLNVYGHLFPDKDETSRAAVGSIFTAREVSGQNPAVILRSNGARHPR